MEDLEDMKTLWNNLNRRVETLEEENRRLARLVTENKIKSARERLIRKYSLFIILSVIMIFYIFIMVNFNPLVVEKYKMVTLIYWSLFFAGEAGVDLYLRENVKKIDVYSSSISEISAMAAKNWKIHKIALMIGLPVAFGAVILMGLLLDANEFTIYGMIVGAIVGLLIGLRQLMKFYENYKFLQSEEAEKFA